MRSIATVFYEDQRTDAGRNNYGPHVLLLACIADDLGKPRWELARSVAIFRDMLAAR